MISIECQHQLPFTKSEVFAAGITADNLPKTISGLILRSSDEILHHKSILHIGLEIPKIPSITMNSHVAEFVQDELVHIRGKSPIGKAAIMFSLTETQSMLTEVNYRLEIGVSRMFGLAGSMIKSFLEGNIDEFTDEYMGNVSDHIIRDRDSAKKAA